MSVQVGDRRLWFVRKAGLSQDTSMNRAADGNFMRFLPCIVMTP